MQGRVAVVTGGSSGIGAALARRMAAAGARVGLVALPDAALEAEADEIRRRGGTVEAVGADVTDRDATRRALDLLEERLGPIDLLVLNAGIGMATRVDDPFSAAEVERLVRVNLLGPVYAIEAVLPGMMERRAGHLVGVSSLSSYRGQPVFSGYCASKAALATLLEGLRIELAERGITVTTVRPGFVRTPMTAGARAPRFMLEADDAARLMMKGIEARRAEINFPWRPAWMAAVARALPRALYDKVAAATILAKYRSERVE